MGLEDTASCDVDERVPLMRVMWPCHEQERISLLTDTVAESLRQIAMDNPRYVKIKSEVKE